MIYQPSRTNTSSYARGGSSFIPQENDITPGPDRTTTRYISPSSSVARQKRVEEEMQLEMYEANRAMSMQEEDALMDAYYANRRTPVEPRRVYVQGDANDDGIPDQPIVVPPMPEILTQLPIIDASNGFVWPPQTSDPEPIQAGIGSGLKTVVAIGAGIAILSMVFSGEGDGEKALKAKKPIAGIPKKTLVMD